MKKKVKFWTVKKIFLTVILSILSVIVITVILSHQNNNKKNAEKVLETAKELLSNLPSSEDIYGLKRASSLFSIVEASYKDGNWNLELEVGKTYSLIFILPKTKRDYEKSDLLKRAIMSTGSNPFSNPPVYVIMNPRFLNEKSMKGVNLDYLASCMLHESVHLYQRTILIRKGLKESNEPKDVIQREKEAYDFQIKFISQILSRNKISQQIIIPSLPKQQDKMTAYDLGHFCNEVNNVNNGKLGFGLASLIVSSEYPDLYASFANINSAINLE